MTQLTDYPERRCCNLDIVEAYQASHYPGDAVPLTTSLAAACFDDVFVTTGINAEGKMDLLIQHYGSRE